MTNRRILGAIVLLLATATAGSSQTTQNQLDNWFTLFPEADTNQDGELSIQEANGFREIRQQATWPSPTRSGVPENIRTDLGWLANRFPSHAICYQDAADIAKVFAATKGSTKIPSHPKPTDGSLRIVGTGHSFMMPGFRTLPLITKTAGLMQPPLVTHTGGGVTGSARYKWEQENGIFKFAGQPKPKLLASIANAPWDAMMWGPYYHDRPEYYRCWIDFCLKFHPEMKFYLSDAWPQIDQFGKIPRSEDELTVAAYRRFGEENNAFYGKLLETLNREYSDRVFVMPTSDAMVLAVEYYHRGDLPGVEGIHTLVGQKRRSLWRDRIGHIGEGFDQLEGYVFYATLYGKSPELLDGDVPFGGRSEYPSRELDRLFRKIAWQAVTQNPLSGVVDQDHDGIGDGR
jgi:hypothetical protein